jgi:hypothetical protein
MLKPYTFYVNENDEYNVVFGQQEAISIGKSDLEGEDFYICKCRELSSKEVIDGGFIVESIKAELEWYHESFFDNTTNEDWLELEKSFNTLFAKWVKKKGGTNVYQKINGTEKLIKVKAV